MKNFANVILYVSARFYQPRRLVYGITILAKLWRARMEKSDLLMNVSKLQVIFLSLSPA